MWQVVMVVIALFTGAHDQFHSRDAYPTEQACRDSLSDREDEAMEHYGPGFTIVMYCRQVEGQDL
jgi:hypothetical protein